MSKVLFIGAGASYGARIKHIIKPPLGFQLCAWLREVCPALLKDYDFIELHATIEHGLSVLNRFQTESNYEQVVAKLEERDERVALQRLIQICFTDLSNRKADLDLGFRSLPDGYDDLIDSVKLGDGSWSIVSLNYDILLEEALLRKGFKYQYPRMPFALNEDQANLPGVRIYKPHGSINFFAHAHHIITHHEPKPDDERPMPTRFHEDEDGNLTPTYPIRFAGMPGAENVLARADASRPSQPVMANYAPLKKSDANQETLLEIRDDALEACNKADELLVVGVRPIQDRGDDPFVAEILGIPVPKYTYVGGDEHECMIIRTLHRHAKTTSLGLMGFLGI